MSRKCIPCPLLQPCHKGLQHAGTVLQELPLKVLTIENAETFSAEHMMAIGGIRSLGKLVIDARKKPFDEALAAVVKNRTRGRRWK